MQIRNNYDILWHNESNTAAGMGIFNGDMGRILEVNLAEEQLTVNFDGRIVQYGFDALLELEHAWALTVHKSQGSEYSRVVLALVPGHYIMLQRNLLYTAVTRAREKVELVGGRSFRRSGPGGAGCCGCVRKRTETVRPAHRFL